MITIRAYEVDGRWQYEICDEGCCFVRQDFDPDEPGLVPMDQFTATSKAEVVVSRVTDGS